MQGEFKTYNGSCHCGAVKFEVQSNLSPALRCNCSLCKRKGAVMAAVNPEHFKLFSCEGSLSLYQFNTRAAKHYFCKVCGIYVFHRPRTNPSIYRVNVGCLEGVEPTALEVGLNDGASLSTISS